MATILAAANGNFNSTATWTGGVVPGSADVAVANNKIIYININTTVTELRNDTTGSATAGGVFYIQPNITLSGNIFAGSTGSTTTACVAFTGTAGTNAFVVGNVTGGTANATSFGLNNVSNGTISLTGNVNGGSASNSFGIYTPGLTTGTINVSGNIAASSSSVAASLNSGNLNLIGNATGSTASRGIEFASSGTLAITGNVTGGTGSANVFGVNNTGSGSVNVYGTITGGTGGNNTGLTHSGTGVVFLSGNFVPTGGQSAVTNASSGTINILSNITATAASGPVISQTSTGIIAITGNLLASNAANAVTNSGGGTVTILGNVSGSAFQGIQNSSSGTVIINGDAYGGSTGSGNGVQNTSTGTVLINGNAYGGPLGIGASNTSTGIMYVKRAKANAFGIGSSGITLQAGVNGAQSSFTYVQEIEYGDRGASPTTGNVFLSSVPTNQAVFYVYNANKRTLVDPVSSTFYPPASSVRSGVSYAAGNSTGTLSVPSASNVSFGVAVDNTTGTAVLTPDAVWQTNNNTLTASSLSGTIGYRLRNVATTEVVGQQIAAYNS